MIGVSGAAGLCLLGRKSKTGKEENMLNEEQDYRPTKMTLVIRVAVGFYLLYTAYSLIEGILASSGNEKLFLSVAAVAFLVIGVLLVYFAGKSLMNGRYAGSGKEAEKEETEVRKITFGEKKGLEKAEEMPGKEKEDLKAAEPKDEAAQPEKAAAEED